MTRLIDADELLKYKTDHEMISTHLIYNAPTVDAVPVRHGKWSVPHGHPNARVCSVCMMIYHEDSARFYDYCPNCGARMVKDD